MSVISRCFILSTSKVREPFANTFNKQVKLKANM